MATRDEMRKRRANADEAGGRTRYVQVKLTAAEEAELKRQAARRDVSVPRLLYEGATIRAVESAEHVEQRRALAVEFMELRRDVSGVSTNLNQISRHANTVSEVPADFDAVLAEVRAMIGRCDRMAEQFTELNRRAIG